VPTFSSAFAAALVAGSLGGITFLATIRPLPPTAPSAVRVQAAVATLPADTSLSIKAAPLERVAPASRTPPAALAPLLSPTATPLARLPPSAAPRINRSPTRPTPTIPPARIPRRVPVRSAPPPASTAIPALPTRVAPRTAVIHQPSTAGVQRAVASRWLPITRVAIPRIGLESAVVLSPLVQQGAVRTWDVPPFAVGQGQYTAGAGQIGTAVLFAHVASLDSGNVFRDLHLVRTGDVVEIFSGARRFDYRVVDQWTVARTDVSVLRPTGKATVVLITCAGDWLPGLDDYGERLVVRADLIASP